MSISKQTINDSSTSIEDLRKLVGNFVHERNWESYHSAKSLSMAISIESAELMEHFLFKKEENIKKESSNFEDFTFEMADIFIYLMSLANSLKIDNFSEIIARKIEKNKNKYPVDKFSGTNYKKQ
jgi:NTP pyrophosphatase (non-canonical NTP hydrolase)